MAKMGMIKINTRKIKSIHNISIEGCNFNTRLYYNFNTNNIGIYTSRSYSKQYRNIHKSKIKKYRQDNKEKISKQRKQYRDNHPKINFLGKDIYTHLPKVKPGYVYHHVIYDHLNRDYYVIYMSSSKHTTLHNYMRYDKIEIQHINVRINDIHGF